MNLLIQAAVKRLLQVLSFLIRKGWLNEDQAFTFIKVFPIPDTTITALVAKEKSLVCTATRNNREDITKYY